MISRFLKEVTKDSPEWAKYELKDALLEDYLKNYEHLNGEWRIWKRDDKKVGVSFHLISAPSNGKPWIGTILVSKEERKKNIGKTILNKIKDELMNNGARVLFGGVPIQLNEWINFMSSCGFEQYKLEKDEEGNSFLIMLCPLE